MLKKIKKFSVIFLCLITILILSILPCSAVSVPNYNLSDDDYKYYLVFQFKNGDTYVVFSNYEIVGGGSSDSFFIISSGDERVKYINTSTNTINYVFRQSIFNFTSNDHIIDANYDVKYQGSDDIFFQKPTLLNNLLKQVPEGVGEKVTMDMGTLTICGISLIVLLIGFLLVPKVFHKFRV